MDDAPSISAVPLSRLVEMVTAFESDRPEIARAQEVIAAEFALLEPAPGVVAAPTTTAAASAEELGAELDESFGRGPAIVGGVAALAAVAGGLVALRRRGGAEGEEADRILEDQPVSRRDMLALIALGGAGLGAGGLLLRSQLPSVAAAAERGPAGVNVLAIVVDDLNDYPTYLGGAPMPVFTPNMDALAAQSRTFTNHHVTVPICPPSRATLMFGLDVQQHGLTSTTLAHEDYTRFADMAIESSLPVLAGRAGVHTIGGGKLFHSEQYVDRWDSFVTTRPATAGTGAGTGRFDHGPLLDGYNPDAELVAFMREFLRTHDGRDPFLMMPGIRLPHLPWRVPQRFLDMYPLADVVVPETPESDWDDLGPVARAQLEQYNDFLGAGNFEIVERARERALLMQAYLASMSHTDSLIGELLDELASSPFADSTVVMLVSDNGYHQGENFAYRKLTLRDQATRTPFMIRPVDGMTFTPGRVDRVVSSTGFMPTILDVLGIAPPVAVRAGGFRDDRVPPAIVTTHVHNSASLVYGEADRGGRWTLHFAIGDEFDPDTVTLDDVAEMELYERATDPQEFENLLPADR